MKSIPTMRYLCIIKTLTIAICAHIFLFSSYSDASEQQKSNINVTSSQKKINLRVKLIIPKDLIDRKYTLGKIVFPIGDKLIDGSKELMKNVFTYPCIDSVSNTVDKCDYDYTLTPELIYSKYMILGGNAWSDARSSFGVEWTLVDLSGKIKWKSNIFGRGVGNVGNLFTVFGNANDNMIMAVGELFEKSQNSFYMSNILRNLSAIQAQTLTQQNTK